MLGTVGDIGCYSFFATKNLAMGEGGMVVARDPALRATVRRLRSHALTVSAHRRHHGGPALYDVEGFGLNYRPGEIACAIGRVQLDAFPAAQAHRRAAVREYRERLSGLPGLVVPYADRPVEDGAHHLFPVVLPPASTARRCANNSAPRACRPPSTTPRPTSSPPTANATTWGPAVCPSPRTSWNGNSPCPCTPGWAARRSGGSPRR